MRKGVSTTIIIILVMLITVSLILISYNWILKYSPQTQWELEKSLAKEEGCLRIENIDAINKKITVRNCGSTQLSNFKVYLDEEIITSDSRTLDAGKIISIDYGGSIEGEHSIYVTSNYAEAPYKILEFPTIAVPFSCPSSPTVVLDNANQYATAYENSRKLFRDKYGKLIALYIGSENNIHLAYSNDNSNIWVDNNLGVGLADPSDDTVAGVLRNDGYTYVIDNLGGRTYPYNTIYGDLWYGQTFKTIEGISLKAVEIYIGAKSFSPTGMIYAKIYETSGGLPTGSPIATSGKDVSYAFGWTIFEFSPSVQLQANTLYALTLNCPTCDSVNYVEWGHAGNTYSNGNYINSTNGGISWIADTNRDMGFRIFKENPMMMIAWTTDTNIYFNRVIFERDGSNNITSFSTGVVHSLIPPLGLNPGRISLWPLHNGEVGAVWGENSISGGKKAQAEFARFSYDDFKKYKNAAGTISEVDQLGAVWSLDHTKTYVNIVQHPSNNAIWVFYLHLGEYILRKIKATWSSPNWSWGSAIDVETSTFPTSSSSIDTANNRVVYAYLSNFQIDLQRISLRWIDSNDVENNDSYILPWGLDWTVRTSLSINGNDYYIFYGNRTYNYILYAKYNGTWSVGNIFYNQQIENNFLSAKFDNSYNKIELIWTQGTNPYKVLYGCIPYEEPWQEMFLSGCSVLDKERTIYYLTNDILNSGINYCMNISTNNVILDCQGHTIDGKGASTSYGIYALRFPATTTNITINNCTVTDWATGGIGFISASGNTIKNSVANSNTDSGIWLYGSSNNQINNITSNSNQNFGIWLYGSSNNQINNITSKNNNAGVYIYGSSNNQLIKITSNNNDYGIWISQSSNNNTITNSKIQDSTSYDMYIQSSGPTPNKIYNNLFNNTNNVGYQEAAYLNYWNNTKQTGTRIYSLGTEIGGNYWTNSTRSGYSDTCTDSDKDGFCDNPLNLTNMVMCSSGINCFNNATDYLPLSDEYIP